MDEVKEAIDMNLSNSQTASSADGNKEDIEIDSQVVEDLKGFGTFLQR
jgi:hypothetical protein